MSNLSSSFDQSLESQNLGDTAVEEARTEAVSQDEKQESTQQSSAAGESVDGNIPAREEISQPLFGIHPFPPPDPNAPSPEPSSFGIPALPADDSTTAGSIASSPEQQPRQPLGREDNALARWYFEHGSPLPVDEAENCRKGAVVHAGLTLQRLEGSAEETNFRACCLPMYSPERLQQMNAYIAGIVDATPTQAEQQMFATTLPSSLPPLNHAEREGALVHAAFTIVRLPGDGLPSVAGAIRQEC